MPRLCSARQHYGTDREAFRNFVQKNCEEDQPAKPVRYQKPRRDGYAIEERMNDEAEQHRITFVRMDEFVFVSLFAEMEVGRNGVLKEVNDQIAQ